MSKRCILDTIVIVVQSGHLKLDIKFAFLSLASSELFYDRLFSCWQLRSVQEQ